MSSSNVNNVRQRSRQDILPGSTSNARCTACGNVFSTSRNFDAHREWRDDLEMNVCVNPGSKKLRLSDKQLWITENEWFKDLADAKS
jgi:hypothetical protein